MSARRTMIIIVALGLGAVAAIATLLYINSAQSRANNNAKLLGVYVVAKDIAKGTTGDQAIGGAMIKRGSIPAQYYPSTAVTDIALIKGKVAPSELVPGEILVNNEFVQPSVAQTSFSGTNIPTGEVAITISLPATNAAAGLIVPGDKIDLMAVFCPGAAGQASCTANSNPNAYAHFFYQNVDVIAVGTEAAPTAGSTVSPSNNGSSLYTLSVPPEAAERILLAQSAGTLWAALVPPGNTPQSLANVPVGAIDSPAAGAGAPPLTPEG